MGVLNKLKGRMSGYNALTKGPGRVVDTSMIETETVENKPREIDLSRAKEMADATQAYETTDRMAKTETKIDEAKKSGKAGSFWSSYATKEERLKDRKKRQVGRAERKEIRKEAKQGEISKEQKRDKIKASRKKQKPTGKQKGDI